MTSLERQLLRWIEAEPMIPVRELAARAGLTDAEVESRIAAMREKGYIAGVGYILPSPSYAAVVGAVNIDIGGTADHALVPADSNPGKVRLSLGGVGRNIAHNLALLEVDTRMITALGDDLYAEKITASCAELGIDLSRAFHFPGEATSTYLYISGPSGDMALAVSDMDIYRLLTPEALAPQLDWINRAQVLVLDANLPAETIAWLCEHAAVPVFADPVSTAKAEKLTPVLGRIHTLKPNRAEAEILFGVTIADEKSAHAAADALLSTGLRRVFLSLGAEGVLAADHSGRVRLRGRPARIVNTTGCGDAFLAALVWAYLQGTDLAESARAGMAAAEIAMESAGTINPAMCEEALRGRLHTE